MSVLFLCITDKTSQAACIFERGEAGLELVFCTPDISEKVPSVDGVKVDSNNPLYLAGCAEAFSQLGWKTFVYPSEKAEIFRQLFQLSVPANLRATFIHKLNLLNKNATQELEDILDQAAARASGK
jgi:hypothetical protein